MSPDTIEKRRARAWPLYRKLANNRWKYWITSDEAIFSLNNVDGQRNVQYLAYGKNRSEAEPYTKSSWPKSVMVWVGMSHRGLTKPIFVKPKAKINAEYYQHHILTPFLKNSASLYPQKNFIFHQDSAPAHKAKTTLKFLQDKEINFLPPSQWPPNSPDAAPCDFFLWGYLKRRLNKRNIRTLAGLQNAIRQELRKVPQYRIDRALKAWPRRLREIYMAKGQHIEKF
jgi:hypothetical protein